MASLVVGYVVFVIIAGAIITYACCKYESKRYPKK
jgi:hypothetical protein